MKSSRVQPLIAALLSAVAFSAIAGGSAAPPHAPKTAAPRPSGPEKSPLESASPKGRKPSKGAKERDLSKVQAVLHVAQGGHPLGDIMLRFFPDIAPNHVRNFVELAEKRVYDGTHFHSVDSRFKIQGGDPFSKLPDRSLHGTG